MGRRQKEGEKRGGSGEGEEGVQGRRKPRAGNGSASRSLMALWGRGQRALWGRGRPGSYQPVLRGSPAGSPSTSSPQSQEASLTLILLERMLRFRVWHEISSSAQVQTQVRLPGVGLPRPR